YAMASGRVGVVNLHAACGLGNGMGMLYNAHVEGTPLIVTAGQVDTRLRFGEPVLDSDLVSVARPWTKWAAEVGRAEDLPAAARPARGLAPLRPRAGAGAHPAGPVHPPGAARGRAGPPAHPPPGLRPRAGRKDPPGGGRPGRPAEGRPRGAARFVGGAPAAGA